jgi:rhamnogalacturonyl hydrolase YesR
MGNGCLQSPNGLYWDHIDLEGNINKTIWSYNQGTMLGASVLFYKVTKDQSYLIKASRKHRERGVLWEFSRLYSQPIVFNSIFFENLLLLDSVKHDPKYLKYMQTYADEIWNTFSRCIGIGLPPTDGAALFFSWT